MTDEESFDLLRQTEREFLGRGPAGATVVATSEVDRGWVQLDIHTAPGTACASVSVTRGGEMLRRPVAAAQYLPATGWRITFHDYMAPPATPTEYVVTFYRRAGDLLFPAFLRSTTVNPTTDAFRFSDGQ